MSDFISKIEINSYRGLKNLQINNLGRINLVVGSNNSGKTSVLEALEIMSHPHSIGSMCAVALSRNNHIRSTAFIDTILSVFQKNNEVEGNKYYSINMSCTCNNRNIQMEANAELKSKLVLVTDDERHGIDENVPSENLVKTMDGTLASTVDDLRKTTAFSLPQDLELDNADKEFHSFFVPTTVGLYRSCVTLYERFIKEDKKNEFIDILKIFDENINDISIVDGTIWIHNNCKETMPLFSYGAGMHKALLIGMAIVGAKDGILLIDEIETAIHMSALKELFKFIVDACKKAQIQLFATTHSIEIIDKLLECEVLNLEGIRIITLTNDDSKEKTFVRVLDGKTAYDERKEYNMELRI